MTTCAIYTRVSSKDQAVKGFSLDAQEKIGKELCKRNKWQYDVFVESGRSADKETLDNRPSLEKILDIAEDKNIQFLFVTELDRLSRNPVTLAYIKKILSDNDIKVITPSQTFDFRDDEDDFMSDLLGILAKRENRLRVKRSRRAKDEAVRLGRWVGATLPFGFTKQPCVGDRLKHNQIVPHPQEKKIYLQMVEWSLSGIGTNSIAAKLTEMGVPTRFSNEKKTYKWKAGVVLRILRNPIYKGDYSFGKASSTIGGIISPEKWQVLQENLKKNYNNAARNTKRFYLLRGLLRCKRCGNRLYGMIKPRKGMRCYCCASKRPDPHPRFCGLKNVPLDVINDYVWGVVKKLVTEDAGEIKRAVVEQQHKNKATEGNFKKEISTLDRQISNLGEQIEKLLDLYTRQDFPVDDLEKKVIALKKRREELELEKNGLLKSIAKTDTENQGLKYLRDYLSSIREQIDTFTDEQRYNLLHVLILRIVIEYDDKTNTHTFDIEFLLPLKKTPPIDPRSRRRLYRNEGLVVNHIGQIWSGQNNQHKK